MQNVFPCIPTEFNLAERFRSTLQEELNKNVELAALRPALQLHITRNKNEHLPVPVKGFCRTVGEGGKS